MQCMMHIFCVHVLGLTSFSTHFRMVPACNIGYDNHWNITQQAVVWYPTQSHYSDKGSISFCVELPFLCRAFDKGALTTNLKFLVWLGQESNLGPLRHGANALPWGYRTGRCAWYIFNWKNIYKHLLWPMPAVAGAERFPLIGGAFNRVAKPTIENQCLFKLRNKKCFFRFKVLFENNSYKHVHHYWNVQGTISLSVTFITFM